MTDEEIIRLVRTSHEQTERQIAEIAALLARPAGQLRALSIAITAMQFQPWFRRELFVEMVAAQQALFEQRDSLDPEIQPYCDELLELLCLPDRTGRPRLA